MRDLLSVWDPKKIWPQNSTIRIKFLSGTEHSIDLFKTLLETQYAPHVNLKFKFVAKNEDAQIRVKFVKGKEMSGSSWEGTKALEYTDQDDPTIDFDFDIEDSWFSDGTYQENKLSMTDIILHELSHMVGMSHDFAREFDGSEEHIKSLEGKIDSFMRQYPSIKTNEDGSECTKPYTEEKCGRLWANFFAHHGSLMEHEDPQSITRYDKRHFTISDLDIEWLKKTYPRKKPKIENDSSTLKTVLIVCGVLLAIAVALVIAYLSFGWFMHRHYELARVRRHAP